MMSDALFLELLSLFEQTDFPKQQEDSIKRLLINKRLYIYGIGVGYSIFKTYFLEKYNLKVEGIIDKKFTCQGYYEGYFAIPPDEFKRFVSSNAIIIVTVLNPEYTEEILSYLQEIGVNEQQIILAKNIYEFNLPYIPQELEEEGFKFYIRNKENIIKAFKLLMDKESRVVYLNFLKTHMLKKVFPIPYHHYSEMYFPKDIKIRYDNFIHCGAYIGDNIKNLQRNIGKIKSLICIEPNPSNYSLLVNFLIKESDKIADQIIALPLAVYSTEIKLNLVNRGSSSSVADHGDVIIQAVALDDVLINYNPTYITFDIEGAELEALKGAERLLREKAPDLAISVYHYPNHIWDIPLYIYNLNPKYKFFLRNYTGCNIETILYATAHI